MAFAYSFYGIQPTEDATSSSVSTIPWVSAFEDVVFLTTAASKVLLEEGSQAKHTSRDIFQSTLCLLDELVSRLDEETDTPFTVRWEPAEWLSTLSDCLQKRVSVVLSVSCLVLNTNTDDNIHDRKSLDYNGSQAASDAKARANLLSQQAYLYRDYGECGMSSISACLLQHSHALQLLQYLRPSFSAYHMRAVNLIWQLDRISTQPHVESVIAQSLHARQPGELQDACEAFGVLWRLTGMGKDYAKCT